MTRASPFWLFDLDNTLHDASHAIFPAINRNMNAYIARVLGDGRTPADADRVDAIRLLYWQRYGATLLGMVKHHEVSEADFLHAAHQFDDLGAMIRAERGLARLLNRLPGQKLLLTNAPLRYARDVLQNLGLHRHFAKHVSIESMRVHGRLRPKPSRPMLRRLLARHGVAPRRAVLVEDTAVNLKAAKAVGLRTVLVTRYLNATPRAHHAGNLPPLASTKRPAYVDVKVKSVRQIPGRLHRLR